MRLDVLIASAMRPNPDLRARLTRAGVSRAELRGAALAGKHFGLFDRAAPLSLYRECFGEPEIDEGTRWLFEMPLWPEHLFEVRSTEGLLSLNGFLFREPLSGGGYERPRNLHDLQQFLRAGYHTTTDVTAYLGDAKHVEGWERMEDWRYHLDSGGEIVLEFDFELLGAIRPLRRRPRPLEH